MPPYLRTTFLAGLTLFVACRSTDSTRKTQNNIVAAVSALDFGTTTVGRSVVRSSTISNGGVGSITVSAFAFDGADLALFTIEKPAFPLVLVNGASLTLTVTYTPTAVGNHTARLLVLSDASNTTALPIELKGQAVAPTCTDGVKNGDEKDTDCGGSCQKGCLDGKACVGNGDCVSQLCIASVCTAMPTLSIAGDAQTEGNDLSFKITLSATIGTDVTVAYATQDGTAKSTVDFVRQAGSVTIGKNNLSTTIVVSTMHRLLYQGDRTFTVNLASPVNATLALAVATGTIRDAEPLPPPSFTYSTNPATYTVNRAITPNTPSISSGVDTWSISPALPTGLAFSTTNGVISGTPTLVLSSTNYTVTATNSGGGTNGSVSLSVGGDNVPPGRVSLIAAGDSFTCAVVDGSAQCWGKNFHGYLGNNSIKESRVPVQVLGLTSGVKAIATGDLHACALVNGGVQCWGYNNDGELGNNATLESHVPMLVAGLTSGVEAIAAGYQHTCGLVNNGLQCWGYNNRGQLGNNSTLESHVPVQVLGLNSGVQAIAGGLYHTCALVNGGMQCWGDNDGGQLGNNSTVDSHVPVQVFGLTSGVEAIATGYQHTCAVVNGGAQCWGYNTLGHQPGNNIPVQAFGLTSGVEAIATGYQHTCAVVNGGAQCWGRNDYGQLGNNSTVDSSVPVQVVISPL